MTDAPMLTIITRTFGGRPNLFSQHIKSLEAQTYQDFQHLIIESKNAGMHYANRLPYKHRADIRGHYAMILDDDDYLADRDVMAELRDVIMQNRPDLIICRMKRPDRVVPSDEHWRRMPFVRGQIGSPCLIMHRNVAIPNLHFFGRATAGDFHLASELEHRAKHIYWWDRVASIIPVVSHGKPEAIESTAGQPKAGRDEAGTRRKDVK